MKYLKNVALALVAFVFVACGSSQSPSEVTKNFFVKVIDKNILPEDLVKEKGFEYAKVEGIVNYRKYVYDVKPDDYNNATYKEVINGDTAKVTIIFKDGRSLSERLRKENGNWILESWAD